MTQPYAMLTRFLPWLHEQETAHRGLYVCRPVTSGAYLQDWAIEQGLPSPESAEKLHVTVVHSRRWVNLPVTLASTNPLVIAPSAFHASLEYIGDQRAIVLRFESSELGARWAEAMSLGATWDYSTYMPHVTLAYPAGDYSCVAMNYPAPTFPLILGPEVYANLTGS